MHNKNGYSKPKITVVRVGFAIPQIVSISAAFLLLNSFLDAYPPFRVDALAAHVTNEV